jgi:hypothetical protein
MPVPVFSVFIASLFTMANFSLYVTQFVAELAFRSFQYACLFPFVFYDKSSFHNPLAASTRTSAVVLKLSQF